MTADQNIVILNVDDTRTSRSVTTLILRKAGFVVVEAATGAEALIRAQHLPQLVLLDVNLPDINGFEVCRRLKTNPHTAAIPVVHLSATYITAEDRVTGLEEGADGYLTQPVEPGELIATIKAFLRLKRTERALQESERWHRALFEFSHDALMTLAPPAWSFTSGNPAARALFGIAEAGEFPARAIWEVSPERQTDGRASKDKAMEMLEIALREGSKFFEWQCVTVSGAEFPASVLLTRIEGDSPLLLATVRNETEKKALEANMAAVDRLASMGTLAASMAHELNNPLAYVCFNMESLAEDLPVLTAATTRCCTALRERVGETAFAEIIGPGAPLLEPNLLHDIIDRVQESLQGTRRMKVMTRGLGMFSRVEQTQQTRVDLQSAIESAIGFATSEIVPRARLVRAFAELPAVWGSEGKLSQVFLNLLVNAAHAISEGNALNNEITVRSWVSHTMVNVEIADTGAGIAAKDLERIFEPFFTTKPAGVGTGLGLAICRRIVTEFGGELRVESQLGKGSAFVVSLPIHSGAPHEQRAETDSSTARDSITTDGRILVIDDEAGLRKLVGRLLGNNDRELINASSGEQAQAILENDQSFDVIICDLMMPGMSGMALHEWLATRCPALARQVIFVTGGAFTPQAAEYLARVGNVTFEKPFDAEALKQHVSNMVRARKGGSPFSSRAPAAL